MGTLRNQPGTRSFTATSTTLRSVKSCIAPELMPDEFARKCFEPLGMRDTGFRPRSQARIAPRKNGVATELSWRLRVNPEPKVNNGCVAGSRPTAYRMGGIGHAGLFSAMRISHLLSNDPQRWQYRGVRILSPLTVATMTRPRLVSDDGGARGLGWDINTSFSTNRGDLFPLGSFGHTGFTGTSLWIDPASQMFVIFLSNRVHPNGKGDVGSLRGPGRVNRLGLGQRHRGCLLGRGAQLARYYEQLTKDQGAFSLREQSIANGAGGNLDVKVLTGIDVLERDGFKQLSGLRIGLVTNHTGRDREESQPLTC
jgi:CubicO group peptidase (beta-lactamase class C family)